MRRETVIQTLQQHRQELARRFSVKSLALFGSVARDEVTNVSDVDLLVEFDPAKAVGLFGLFALQDYLEELLGCPVDLGTFASLKPHIRDQVLLECVSIS